MEKKEFLQDLKKNIIEKLPNKKFIVWQYYVKTELDWENFWTPFYRTFWSLEEIINYINQILNNFIINDITYTLNYNKDDDEINLKTNFVFWNWTKENVNFSFKFDI